MTLRRERRGVYQALEERIGGTPLVTYTGSVPNNNTIWIKRECDNPFGSHYDRVYLALFRHFEESGKIQPGEKVLETTSGTAGASFAGIGKLLGYECYVAIPEGVDRAIIRKIQEEGAVTYFTPEKDYVSGFPAFLKRFLPRHPDFKFLNHSMGPKRGPAYTNNEITLAALQQIGTEVAAALSIDYFLPAVGNGSSVLGTSRAFTSAIRITPFEHFQSAVLYDQLYPDRYERQFGIKPGSLPRHKLRGTSFQGIDFPHIKNAVTQGLIHDAYLVSDKMMDACYLAATGRRDAEALPHWDAADVAYEDLGRSGRAGIAVALRLAQEVSGKNLLLIAYDKADRYDSETVVP